MRSTELPATRLSMLASTSIPTDCGPTSRAVPTPWTVLDSIVARRAPVTRMPSTPTTSSVGREPTSSTVLCVIDAISASDLPSMTIPCHARSTRLSATSRVPTGARVRMP